MGWLYLANVVVLVVAAWAVWERRLTFRSRWDAPITHGIVLYGLGAALDSPWPAVAAASFAWSGKYYLLTGLGHICYLCGSVGIRSIYLRLLPDNAIDRFTRRFIMIPIAAAAAVMLACLIASPVTSTMPQPNLYLVPPDGYLRMYWVTFLGTLTGLAMVSLYGLARLRLDVRSVMINLLIGSQALGMLACLSIGFAVLTDRVQISGFLVWPFVYAGIVGGAVAAVAAWRHRLLVLIGDPPSGA